MVTLTIGEFSAPVAVVETGVTPSQLTDRTLRTLTVGFRVDERAAFEAASAALQDHASISLELDEETIDCALARWSYRETPPDSPVDFTLELTERDEAAPHSVTVGGLAVVPVRYEESWDERAGRTIRMTVSLDSETTRQLRAVLRSDEPFEIVRHGVTETPVRMKAGNTVHSVHGDMTKTRFALVDGDRKRDDLMKTLWLPVGKGLKLLVDERRRTDQLLALLVSKGVVSQDEADALLLQNEELEREIAYQFSEVNDADDDWL